MMAHGENAERNGHRTREYQSRRGQWNSSIGKWAKTTTHRAERRAAMEGGCKMSDAQRIAEKRIAELEAKNKADAEYLDENDPRYPELLARVTRAIRESDEGFEKTGGSSRHWVRDWFLPKMQEHGLSFAQYDGVTVATLRERVAGLEDVITRAYNADCETGDDGGVLEGEAAMILATALDVIKPLKKKKPRLMRMFHCADCGSRWTSRGTLRQCSVCGGDMVKDGA